MDFLILFGLFQMAHSQFDSKLTNQRAERAKADHRIKEFCLKDSRRIKFSRGFRHITSFG